MLGWRLAMSAILIPAFFAAFWVDQQTGAAAYILYGLCLALSARSVWEFIQLVRPRYPEVLAWPPALGAAAVLTAAWLPAWLDRDPGGAGALGPVAIAFALYVLAAFALEAWRYETPGRRVETAAMHVLATAYVGVLLAGTAQLRWVAGADDGYYVLGSMVIATKMGDTGAYTFGRLFGRRKMAPRLSPGKTWAGFVGALVGAALGGWAWLALAAGAFDCAAPSPLWALPYGALMGLVGLIGDLCESLIKRDMQQKDAPPLFPGFGGLLDLLDSILFAGPVAYVYWLLFQP